MTKKLSPLDFESLRDTDLVRSDIVARATSYSPMQLWRLEKAGKFPRRIKVGANRVAWLWGEIRQWRDARIAARFEGSAA